jgi:hypothetical protein
VLIETTCAALLLAHAAHIGDERACATDGGDGEAAPAVDIEALILTILRAASAISILARSSVARSGATTSFGIARAF